MQKIIMYTIALLNPHRILGAIAPSLKMFKVRLLVNAKFSRKKNTYLVNKHHMICALLRHFQNEELKLLAKKYFGTEENIVVRMKQCEDVQGEIQE